MSAYGQRPEMIGEEYSYDLDMGHQVVSEVSASDGSTSDNPSGARG